MADDIVELDTTALDRFTKALKGKIPVARVGILGDKTNRDKVQVQDRSGKITERSGPSNAEVGAAHEFGTGTLPKRSFLRMPIDTKLADYVEKAGGSLNEDSMKEVIKAGTITNWMQKLGKIAESVVLDAFKTGGFGTWQPSNMSRKKVKQTLVESQQLRNSITSDVKE